jgi:hypothetical protein
VSVRRVKKYGQKKWFHITFADLAHQQLFPYYFSFCSISLFLFAVVEVLQIVLVSFVQINVNRTKVNTRDTGKIKMIQVNGLEREKIDVDDEFCKVPSALIRRKSISSASGSPADGQGHSKNLLVSAQKGREHTRKPST